MTSISITVNEVRNHDVYEFKYKIHLNINFLYFIVIKDDTLMLKFLYSKPKIIYSLLEFSHLKKCKSKMLQ